MNSGRDVARNERFREKFEGAVALVTGGAGFIGSHLVRRLVDLGVEVRVLDDLSSGSRDNLSYGLADLRVDSILDRRALDRALRGCRYVFHQAAVASVPLSIHDPEHCYAVNTTAVGRLLDTARRHRVEKVVLASTAAVYGRNPGVPARESDLLEPCSPYAASRCAAELMGMAAARSHGLGVVGLRYFNVFGSRRDPSSPYATVVSAFVDALLRGEAPTIHGDGLQTRDFTHVDDVVEANLLSVSAPVPIAGRIFNVGTGVGTNLRDLARVACAVVGRDVAPQFAPARSTDVRDCLADIALARALLGYEPRVGLREGIERLVRQSRASAAA